ncbi:MAG: hypothetical protein CL678_07185 [Bdellovibrionaceae bacterium]|nr:hypothetical protein [Pseudobdellovibrionaceae bacterium]|tara:strand:+ start:344 stop:1723 length:1380 start_codon:yes stop_codon:yes gene_type:complete
MKTIFTLVILGILCTETPCFAKEDENGLEKNPFQRHSVQALYFDALKEYLEELFPPVSSLALPSASTNTASVLYPNEHPVEQLAMTLLEDASEKENQKKDTTASEQEKRKNKINVILSRFTEELKPGNHLRRFHHFIKFGLEDNRKKDIDRFAIFYRELLEQKFPSEKRHIREINIALVFFQYALKFLSLTEKGFEEYVDEQTENLNSKIKAIFLEWIPKNNKEAVSILLGSIRSIVYHSNMESLVANDPQFNPEFYEKSQPTSGIIKSLAKESSYHPVRQLKTKAAITSIMAASGLAAWAFGGHTATILASLTVYVIGGVVILKGVTYTSGKATQALVKENETRRQAGKLPFFKRVNRILGNYYLWRQQRLWEKQKKKALHAPQSLLALRESAGIADQKPNYVNPQYNLIENYLRMIHHMLDHSDKNNEPLDDFLNVRDGFKTLFCNEIFAQVINRIQ